MVRAIQHGFPQREIERRDNEHQRAVEANQRIIVGVNDFVVAEDASVPVATVDPRSRPDQVHTKTSGGKPIRAHPPCSLNQA